MRYIVDVTTYQTNIEFDTKRGAKEEEIQKEKFIKKLKETLKTFSLYDEVWLGSIPKVCYEFAREYKSESLACLRITLSIRFNEVNKKIEADLKNMMKLLFDHTQLDIWFMARVIIEEHNKDLSNINHISVNTEKLFNADLKNIKDFETSLKIMKAEVK